jgi:hypothetical protein
MLASSSPAPFFRHSASRLLLTGPVLLASFALSGCTCNDTPAPAPAPVTAAPAPVAAPVAEPAEPAPSADDRRQAKRNDRRNERREQRKASFDNQKPVFEYAVKAATPAADALRAKIMANVQPAAGVPLRWTLRSCESETLWDDPSATLKGQGATLVIQTSLDSSSCAPTERTRSTVEVAHYTTDTEAARSTHQRLSSLSATNQGVKVTVESATVAPESPPVFAVRALERQNGTLATVDPATGLGKAVLDRFVAAGTPTTLSPVCGESLTVRHWVLEEEQALPPKDDSPPSTGKRGKTRAPKERHRSWAQLSVWSSADGASVHHASLHMRGASKRETNPAQQELPTKTYTDLKAAGLVDAVPLIDARYRCGG